MSAATRPTTVPPADFVTGGKALEQVEVKISYGIIDRFSEGLYSSPNKAFEELVSNSYDAGASRVWVRVPQPLDDPDATLAVVDDGVSMDLQGLQELWEIGVSPKRNGSERRERDRPPIGKFGIGKLATYVLAKKLTYLCFRDDTYLAVTMDYGQVSGKMMEPTQMALQVVELTAEEAQQALSQAVPDASMLRDLFGDAAESWTAAILSDLKPAGRGIQVGRLRWILSTALPLSPAFRLWLNEEAVEPAKATGDRQWTFTVGKTDTDIDKWPYASRVIADTDEAAPGIELPAAGVIRGTAELFAGSLKGGRAEERGRSHGFFVKVRGRLVNLEDETFGIDVELHHGVLTRFRMELEADGLDAYIASPRESIRESAALTEVREYLLAVFNRARAERQRIEDRAEKAVLGATGRVAAPPPALSQEPLRRILRRAVDGEELLFETVSFDDESERTMGEALTTSDDNLLERILIRAVPNSRRLVVYVPSERAVVVNLEHPFVNNFVDDPEAAEPLRLVGATELLTEVYMLDEDVSATLVRKILDRRDQFLRALVNIHPRSAPVIARALRDSRDQEKELEDSAADALQLLGFEVTRISGKGAPDGVARARLGHRLEEAPLGYSVTYDTKSSGKEAIAAATTKTNVLKVHREDHSADYTLLVAPGYQGEDLEESLLQKLCENDAVTPIRVEDLARLVENFPFRHITPQTVRPLFDQRTPPDAQKFIDELLGQPPPEPPPLQTILETIVEYSERKDPVSIETLNTVLFERMQKDFGLSTLGAVIGGIAALAPQSVWFDGEHVALNASVEASLKELSDTIAPLPDELAGSYKSLPGVGS
jgi:Histidine kinase-, DNA gyrase B-, and HSP90-like ATPase